MYSCMYVCNACICNVCACLCVYACMYVCMYAHEHSRARTYTRYESVDQYLHSPKLRYKLHRDKL